MKILNKILSMVTALTMILCGLAACDSGSQNTETEPRSSTYTVHCVDESGAPVSGVLVLFTDAAGATELAITNETGLLTIDSETGMRTATVSTIPNGYACADPVSSFDSSKELTFVLTKIAADNDTVSYKVIVVDQNGQPVSGVELQFCDENSCRQPVRTDETGTVSQNYIESEYHVTVNDVPDGYSVAETVYYFEDGATEMTITVTAE